MSSDPEACPVAVQRPTFYCCHLQRTSETEQRSLATIALGAWRTTDHIVKERIPWGWLSGLSAWNVGHHTPSRD